MIQSESGFTLVELLVVLVIIGILAATSLMSYGTVRDKVYKVEQATLLNQLRTAFEARSGDVNSLAVGAYRRVYNSYRTDTWRANNTTNDELIPGMKLPNDTVAGHSSGANRSKFYIYALERNCNPAAGNCWRYQLFVRNCWDGWTMRWQQRQNGSIIASPYYRANDNNRCGPSA